MATLNFREIPEAHIANGLQDTFEQFTSEFLKYLGYKVLSIPDRGPDGGSDLIVQEERRGIAGITKIKWLVSCKHKAHSGSSVTPTVEQNINDRLSAHDCNAFMGVYSTIPSSGLTRNLKGLENSGKEFIVYDRETIEGELLKSVDGLKLIRRFFPLSYRKLEQDNPRPALIFNSSGSLNCHVCDKELLADNIQGIIVSWSSLNEDNSDKEIKFVKWVCKGKCDSILVSQVKVIHPDLIDKWEDIPDVAIPEQYLRWIMVIFNELHGDLKYSDEAFKDIKDFMLNIFPHISRHLTNLEKERMEDLNILAQLPG